MHLRILVISIVVLSAVAFAQPGTDPQAYGAPLDAYLIHYAANLNVADAYVNITNAGTNGATIFGGTKATVNGAICANAYVFDKDEQLVACCSCPVTPNGLFSLSVQKDLINNIMSQQAIPTAVTIKLTATEPVKGSCAGSAFAAAPIYVSGLRAWGTSTHANTSTTPATYQITEGLFLPAELSVGEAGRLTQLCTFFAANGSGFGVCNPCKPGGLASSKK